MNALSNRMENELVNHFLRGIPSPKRGSFWFALFTANPGDGGTANEVAGGSYARVEVKNTKENFPLCPPGGVPTKTNGESILFPTASATWGTVTHWAAYDAPGVMTFTGNTTISNQYITAIPSTASLRVGMSISGAGLPAGCCILQVNDANTVKIFTPDPAVGDLATASGTGTTFTVTPNMIVHGKLEVKRFVKSGKTLKLVGDTLQLTLQTGNQGGFSDLVQRRMLNHVFGHLTAPCPAKVYMGFGTSMSVNNSDSPDTIEEWDDDSYSRQEVTFDPPSNGICDNSNEMLFTAVDGVVGGDVQLNCVGIWDDDNAGNLLVVNRLRRNLNMKNENLLKLLPGDGNIQLQ